MWQVQWCVDEGMEDGPEVGQLEIGIDELWIKDISLNDLHMKTLHGGKVFASCGAMERKGSKGKSFIIFGKRLNYISRVVGAKAWGFHRLVEGICNEIGHFGKKCVLEEINRRLQKIIIICILIT